MSVSRRSFIKQSGCALLGAGVTGSALAAPGRYEKAPGGSQGKRWAMIIDTKKCLQKSGCTACLDACHLAHNVPEIEEPMHEIKWIWKEHFKNAFPTQVHEYTEVALKDQPVVVLCNHCESPPCVRVCPTGATFKREDGIVTMDMHRCVGCRYCMAACPYGARSFNFKDPRPHIKEMTMDFPTRCTGVVEKCNFCAERLAFGKIPKCVEVCKSQGNGALMFGDLDDPSSGLVQTLMARHNIRRKTFLGTGPNVFYLV